MNPSIEGCFCYYFNFPLLLFSLSFSLLSCLSLQCLSSFTCEAVFIFPCVCLNCCFTAFSLCFWFVTNLLRNHFLVENVRKVSNMMKWQYLLFFLWVTFETVGDQVNQFHRIKFMTDLLFTGSCRYCNM